MGRKSPLEDEFYNSLIYKNLNDVGGKVAQGIGKAVEEVGKAIGNNAKGGYNPVQPPPGQNPPPNAPPPSYNPPPKRSGGYTQDSSGNYRYVPPKNPGGGPAPQQGWSPKPPPANWQPGANRQAGVRPVPPPKPIKFKKKGYGGRRFLFTAAVACLAVAFIPLNGPALFAASIASAIGGYFLSRLVFRDWSRKKPVQEPQTVPQAAPRPAERPVEKTDRKRSDTGNPELDKIIDEGNDYIEKLRKANDSIADEGISGSIDRMEKACEGIFAYVKDRPEKVPQIKRFLNYYLPTTLKLLGSYEKLSRQAVKGENISATMFDIEGMMQTIATAFEKQLDGLFGDEAMDIQADIAVFESILQQEGLKNDGQVQLK